ncbi:MAG: isocitrate lyase/PEP mutase family protein [Chloroflexi bacterium]|nr:isocitrate lyase/PEP mutase family protein [Chloroflexota bacterium]MYF65241.1 isocitrate lyase/PEP mutase family protein [Chloroflexota bacterium]MYK34484.1 isocitrate lyase/PEP mutase family protein [Chloroflexota bacterium]
MRTTTRLRELLASPGIVPAPGAYDCLSAAVIERAGFPVVYMTGAGTSISRTGYPDIGLTTMSEMVANAAAIARTVSVPVIADADTGYGDVLQVQRTIREYERAGVAGIHIEDQESPKRCGHLDDKRVVPQEEMVRKLHAALDAREDDDFTIIARCDALAVTGWDDALRRCEAYVEAGADVLFLEAIQTREQATDVTGRFDVPVLYNFVETGKSPLLPIAELEELGFKLVIFPISAMLAALRTMTDLMRELRETGTTAHLVADRMVSIQECFETVGLSDMLALDATYAGSVR